MDRAIEALDQLLGTWEFTMHHADVSKPIYGRHVYERVLDGAFVLHRCVYDRSDFPDAMALMTDTTYHYFDVRGITRIFKVEFKDHGWSTINVEKEFSQRTVARFKSREQVEVNGKRSHDNGVTWQPDYTMTSRRVI